MDRWSSPTKSEGAARMAKPSVPRMEPPHWADRPNPGEDGARRAAYTQSGGTLSGGTLFETVEIDPIRVLADARRLGEAQGLRFMVVLDGIERDAFAVRYRGTTYGFLNCCRHQSLPLDFGDAHFFDDAYDALVCCHHGARYRPETGDCIDGPCAGGRLTRLVLEEREGALWCTGVRVADRPASGATA